jgi:GAF domain-containing protein
MELSPTAFPTEYQPQMICSLDRNDQYKALFRVISHIRESLDLEIVFKTTVTEVRQVLNTDRVGIFKFHPHSEQEGEFIYEDVGGEWPQLLTAPPSKQCCFAEQFAFLKPKGWLTAINDISHSSIADCQAEIFSEFPVRAVIIAPLLQGQQLWGLLCVYQCSSTRQWELWEIEFVQLIAEHLGIALQQADYVEQVKLQSAQLAQAKTQQTAAQWQRIIGKTVEKIRQSLDLETIFRTSTEEIRQLLKCDRVAIYRFNPDWSGEFVFESVADGWVALMQKQLQQPELSDNISECQLKNLANPPADTYLQDTEGGRFSRGEVYRVCNDIYNAGFNDCYINVLESYQARAYVIVAIIYQQKLWGLLGVYQNTNAREWQQHEVYFLAQVAAQLCLALQQAESLKQVQTQAEQLAKAAERQKTLAATIEKIRQSLNLNTIFATTTTEVRRLLEVERVTIYRFAPDWSGEFVAESLSANATPVGKLGSVIADEYLQKTQGGDFVQGQILAIRDIQADNYNGEHLILNQPIKARAYIIVPIFLEEKLWGLLAAYQQNQPRDWQADEIDLLLQISSQLGVGIKQAELLAQTKHQKAEIAQTLKELQLTQSQLIQSEKMAGLGQLVAGMAHEINNPISFIYGNIPYVTEHTENLLKLVNLYQEYYPQPVAEIEQQAAAIELDFIADDLPLMLNSMRTGAERIRQLVLSLRNFSRLEEAEMKPVDVHEGIESTLLILQHRLQGEINTKAIEVIREYADLPPVTCYAAKMNQVFMNILNNAIDAIETSHINGVTTENPQIRIRTAVTAANQIQIWIADNGCGIPKAIVSRIFEPFFTTKEPGKGIGLGLSISYQIIVEGHGGKIQCLSNPGQGCEFQIQIPINRL